VGEERQARSPAAIATAASLLKNLQQFWKTLERQSPAKRDDKNANHFNDGLERQPSFSKTFLGGFERYQWVTSETIWRRAIGPLQAIRCAFKENPYPLVPHPSPPSNYKFEKFGPAVSERPGQR
jgi:hypothetical protein